MNVELLKRVLAVPTHSHQEDEMVQFLVDHVRQGGVARRGRVATDEFNNVYIVKGNAQHYPCVAAHIDSVQPLRPVEIVEEGGRLVGFNAGHQVGIGADDKAGVFVCLELLERFDNIAIALFAGEEVGCFGATHSNAEFFKRVGYVLEFDCPSNDLFSYTVSGVRLFENQGDFIRTGLPVLNKWGVDKWQNHPYTDVTALRKRFTMSCMNLPCGYYRWHQHDEFVLLSDTENSIGMATELVTALGAARYEYVYDRLDESEPLVPVTALYVRSPVPA
jgi:di/tripeptidase